MAHWCADDWRLHYNILVWYNIFESCVVDIWNVTTTGYFQYIYRMYLSMQYIYNVYLPLKCATYSTNRIHEQLAAEEAHASQDLDGLCQKSNVIHRLREIDVAKVTRTLGHIPCTSLAAWTPVHHPLAWVHQPTKLRTATFHCLRVANTTLSDRHSTLQHKWSIT